MRAWNHLQIVSAGVLALGALTLARNGLATVGEQRARLPPPAPCSDAVEGVWKSHSYHPSHFTSWSAFTLEIHRAAPDSDRLVGTISNHAWVGDAEQEHPKQCAGDMEYVVSMDAVGKLTGNQVQFGGVGEWRLDEVSCGEWYGGYNLDNFTGVIEPEIQEFQSVNNDGGISVNEPTVFRRVKCLSDALEPKGEVAPPPYQPPVGCSLW